MMNKDDLLAKGNDLIDRINAAMEQIEICESAKEKIAMPEARLGINFYDGNGGFKPYELKKALPDKSMEKIKAYIMSEFDLQMDEAMKFLDKVGLAPEVVTTDAGDVYVDDHSSADDFDIVEDITVPAPEPDIEAFETYPTENPPEAKKGAKTAKKGGTKRKK